MKARALSTGGLLLAIVALIAVNVLGNQTLRGARLDFTTQGLYTLTPGTRHILAALDEPVTLRLYLSQRLATSLPGIKGYTTRVRELLREYELQAHGALRVEIIDPEPFSEAEDRAVGYGIRGVPLGDGESTFYFGLVASGPTGEEEVLPFLSQRREQFLEYDLTKLIYQVSRSKKPVVGLLSTLPVEGVNPQLALGGAPGQAWTIIDQIRQLFEIRTLDPALTDLDDDIDVLMLVHPKGLGAPTLYAIDQFILRGGKALVFVDPLAEADAAAARTGAPRSSNPDKLLAAWGLRLDSEHVVADLPHATRVQTQRSGQLKVVDYPVWVTLPASALDAGDIVTGDLDSLTLASAGALTADPKSKLSITPLVRSSPEAMLLDTSALGFDIDPERILRDYQPGGKALMLAARVTGKLHSAFPDGAPAPSKPGAKQAPAASGESQAQQAPAPHREHLAESTGEANLLVVADTDLLRDRFWVQVQNFLGSRIAIPTSGNGSFVVNALDNLAGSSDLISVRSRGTFTRPFLRLDAIRQRAERKFREKERELKTELDATERKLADMQDQKQGGEAIILSKAQQQAIAGFRSDRVRIRKELRDVRHALRIDIERIETWLKFINIGLVPILIGLGGLAALGWRSRHSRRAARLPARA